MPISALRTICAIGLLVGALALAPVEGNDVAPTGADWKPFVVPLYLLNVGPANTNSMSILALGRDYGTPFYLDAIYIRSRPCVLHRWYAGQDGKPVSDNEPLHQGLNPVHRFGGPTSTTEIMTSTGGRPGESAQYSGHDPNDPSHMLAADDPLDGAECDGTATGWGLVTVPK